MSEEKVEEKKTSQVQEPHTRFKIDSLTHECCVCKQPVCFGKETIYGFYCMECTPVAHFCFQCKNNFVSKHSNVHKIGVYYRNEKDFIKHYRSEMEKKCKILIKQEKYEECIRYLKKALKINVSSEIALFSFRVGINCHVKLFEYSEARKCGKFCLEIIKKLRNKDKNAFEYDEVDVKSKLCHIFLKLEQPMKCLKYGLDIINNDSKFSSFSNEFNQIKYCCGTAYFLVGKYKDSKEILQPLLMLQLKSKYYVKARYSLKNLLECFLLEGKRDEGLKFFKSIRNDYPEINTKQGDLDLSYVKLKKVLNKLQEIPELNIIDFSFSLNGKTIHFNKQHYAAIIDNDFNSSYNKLYFAIEISEDLIMNFGDNLKVVDGILKKRGQLIERMYCCCLLKKKPNEAFQWAERGRNFYAFREKNKKGKKELIDVSKLIKIAKENDVFFIYYVLVHETHFGAGDFIDCWIINPRTDSFQKREIIRFRYKERIMDLMKITISLYNQVNRVNDFFRREVEKQNFDSKNVKKFHMFVDKLFESMVKKKLFQEYNRILEKLYKMLIVPINTFLPEKYRKKKVDSSIDNNNSVPLSEKTKKPRRLIVVPDSILSFIPFSFLRKKRNIYFIDSYCISITHSIEMFYHNLNQVKEGRLKRKNTLLEKLKRIRSKTKPIEVVDKRKTHPFSPYKSPPPKKTSEKEKLSLFAMMITDSFDEIRKVELLPIYQLLKSSNNCEFSNTILVKNSTKKGVFETFKSYGISPKILHLSNHSSCSGKNLPTFQRVNSSNSGFCLMNNEKLFAKDFGTTNLDGTEISIFSRASLVSCEIGYSGLGEFQKILFLKGVPTILYPLFPVSDFFTSLFLIQFYKNLVGTDLQVKKTKGEAFREAVLSSLEIFPLLRDCPFYLSPFVLSGDSISVFS